MTGPRQPRTCSHPINARTLTGVCQTVLSISCICIQGILESDLLSQSTPVNQMDISLFINALQHKC